MKTRLFKNNIIQEIGWYSFSNPKVEKFHRIPKTYKKTNSCSLIHWNIRGNLIDRSKRL